MNYVEDILENQVEQWKQFEETAAKQYFVSTKARIKNIDKETGAEAILKTSLSRAGRPLITIEGLGTFIVYRLVAEAFIPNPENKPTVNHLGGIAGGHGIDNLAWATYKEQREHALNTGLATPGFTPAIVLNSNGDIIARYDTTIEAMTNYDGRQVYYNEHTQIIGNVIVMKESYYSDLDADELFYIATNCFERMMEFAYVVDGQFIDYGRQAATLIGCSQPVVPIMTKGKWSTNIKGHSVTRMANVLGVSTDVANTQSYTTV